MQESCYLDLMPSTPCVAIISACTYAKVGTTILESKLYGPAVIDKNQDVSSSVSLRDVSG